MLMVKSFPTRLQVFKDIGELLSLKGVVAKDGRRIVEDDLSIIPRAIMVAKEGRVAWVGSEAEFKKVEIKQFGEQVKFEFHSLEGRTVMPAFVEPHTHLVFAGDRSEEFEWRQSGLTYQEIAQKGGGILSTVKATRQASESDLLALAQLRAQRFLRQGVTTLEVKSGYGLSLESELRILKVAKQIQGPRVVTTYLGPHSRSPEAATYADTFEQVLNHDLEKVIASGLADRADIYIEKGFFTVEQGERYFARLKERGFPFTAHVEQLSELGGIGAALKFGPQSVDHVVYATAADISALAAAPASAVLLPTSDFYLKMKYPPAREMIQAGVRVALSTDFNPGTSPTDDLSLVGVLARIEMKMTLPEVLAAYTYGSACALGLGAYLGSLSIGKLCDFNVLQGSWRNLFYSVGTHPIHQVYREGKLIS